MGLSFHDKPEVLDMIPCTACHYCVEENHCPMQIKIPELLKTVAAEFE